MGNKGPKEQHDTVSMVIDKFNQIKRDSEFKEKVLKGLEKLKQLQIPPAEKDQRLEKFLQGLLQSTDQEAIRVHAVLHSILSSFHSMQERQQKPNEPVNTAKGQHAKPHVSHFAEVRRMATTSYTATKGVQAENKTGKAHEHKTESSPKQGRKPK